MNKRAKKWSEMGADELRKATRKYDEEFAADAESTPLSAAQKTIHRQARKAGRPKVGKGSRIVSLSVEKELLVQADTYAKRNGLGRSEMFVLGIKGPLGTR